MVSNNFKSKTTIDDFLFGITLGKGAYATVKAIFYISMEFLNK